MADKEKLNDEELDMISGGSVPFSSINTTGPLTKSESPQAGSDVLNQLNTASLNNALSGFQPNNSK